MIIRVLVMVLISWQLSAQHIVPAPFLGMGGASLAQSGVFALAYNPVGAANLESLTIAAAYQQHFLATDIATQAILLGLPLKNSSTVGLTFVNYGIFDLNSFFRTGFSYSKNFGKNITASLTANYHLYAVKQYQSESTLSADLSFKYNWSKFLQTAVLFKNIGNNRLSTMVDERIERELGVGFLYLIGSDIHIAADVVKDFAADVLYRAGVSYFFSPLFCMRTGASSGPLKYTAGCGFADGKWTVDFAFTYHRYLNMSPQLAMSYAF